jgi:transposase-like protein
MAEGKGLVDPNRRCPKCGSPDYQFRSRKKVIREDGTGPFIESRFRCKACTNVWREKTQP